MQLDQVFSPSANISCPYPFIPELSFPYRSGYASGRFCKTAPTPEGGISCCLPCPVTEWRYSSGYKLEITAWLGLISLILASFLGISYIVLPVSVTRRHFLTICPITGLAFIALAFVVPLGPSVEECYDAITPNDWKSDAWCAVTAALLHYGSWVIITSCFFRSLSLYLHLCWEIELGKRFLYASLFCIFGGSAALLVPIFLVAGVAPQASKVCSINRHGSLNSLWATILPVSGLAIILQLVVIRYSVYRVLEPFRTMNNTPTISPCDTSSRGSSSFSLAADVTACSMRQILAKVFHVLQLQWRAAALVFLVFLLLLFEAQAVLSIQNSDDLTLEEALPWVLCLVESKGDRDACVSYAAGLGTSEPVALAAYVLVSSSGVFGLVLVLRWSMVQGWIEWFGKTYSAVRGALSNRKGDEEQAGDVERAPSENWPMNSPYILSNKSSHVSVSSALSDSDWDVR